MIFQSVHEHILNVIEMNMFEYNNHLSVHFYILQLRNKIIVQL